MRSCRVAQDLARFFRRMLLQAMCSTDSILERGERSPQFPPWHLNDAWCSPPWTASWIQGPFTGG